MITIITAFGGRRYCFKEYKDGLLALDYPKDKIKIVFHDGSNDPSLKKELDKIGKLYQEYIYIKDTREPMMGITAGEPKKSERIASVYKRIKNKVPECDYILSIEDDIKAKPDSLKKLLKSMKSKVGCVFGRQICRWMEEPLVWKLTPKYTFPKGDTCREISYSAEILPVKDRGVEEVDGMPMGFNLIRYDLFKKENFRANDYGITGFDLIFSIDIKNWGYKVLVDWGIHCKHFHDYDVKSKYGSYNIKKVLE